MPEDITPSTPDVTPDPTPAPAPTPAPEPEPEPAQPPAITEERILELIELKTATPEPDPSPEPEPPVEATPDPRDATMRSLLIKANNIPESLVEFIPANPTEAEKVMQNPTFMALAERERNAATVQPPADSAPKPAAPKGDSNAVRTTPKSFSEVTTDDLREIGGML